MKKNFLSYNPVGFYTLFSREIHRFMKVSVQTLVAPLLSNILYLAIFGGVLKTRSADMGGMNYLQYIMPGLAGMGAIFAAFQNPAFSIISQKYQNTIQDLNSYPISNIEKTLAFVLGGTVRGLLIGLLTYLATGIFVGFTIVHPIWFFGMITITSFVFASFGLLCGLLITSNEMLSFVLSIVITPLTYLGGVFFEISKLPGVLSNFKYINPVYPLVNLSRFAYLGAAEGSMTLQGIAVAIMTVGMFGLGTFSIRKGYGLKIT